MAKQKRKNTSSRKVGKKVSKHPFEARNKESSMLQDSNMIEAESPKLLASLITLMHRRDFISFVNDFPITKLYDTNTNGKFTYHVSNSANFELADANETRVVPVLRQLEYIADNMVKTNVLELKWANCSSEFYDYEGVIRLKEIVKCKMVKDIMEVGKRFIFDDIVPTIQSYLAPIDQASLHSFWNTLEQSVPGSRVTLSGRSISSDALCSLVSLQSPINEEILDHIGHILNESSKSHRTVVANLKVFQENTPLLINRIKQMFGSSLMDVNIILYMIICDETFGYSVDHVLNVSPQHYVFGVYSVNENKVLYVDTLAKPVPKSFFTTFVKLSKDLGKDVIYFGLCHEEGASVEHRECRQDCLYPFQRCRTVGGIAVIVGMSIFALDRQMFQVMIGQCSNEEFAEKVSYLRDISLHLHFLKVVIINWIMTGIIDLSQIYKQAKVRNVSLGSAQEIEYTVVKNYNVIKEASTTIKKELSPEQSWETGKNMTNTMYRSGSETKQNLYISHKNTWLLNDKSNVDVESQKVTLNVQSMDPVESKSELNQRATTSIPQKILNLNKLQHALNIKTSYGHIPIYFDEVHYLLAGRPGICFKRKEWSYCVECPLAKGVKRYKFFKCDLDKGRDDREALSQIQEFFTPDKFLQWMKDDVKSKCKINAKSMQIFSPDSAASGKMKKNADDFDPEITIVLNEYTKHFSEEKLDVSVNSKQSTAQSVKFCKTIPNVAEGKVRTPQTDEIPLPSRPECSVTGDKEKVKFSIATTVRVKCKHGRIPVYFGEVQHLIIGRPTLAYRKKKCCYNLECTFYNGITGYKNFSCHRGKGRDDLDALKHINEFLKLEKFTPWLKNNLKFKHRNKRISDGNETCNRKAIKTIQDDFKECGDLSSEEANIIMIDTNVKKETEADAVHICMEICDTGVVDKYVTSVNDNLEADNQSPAALNFERIKDFIVGKPKVHFRKAKNMFRVECLLWNGNKVHKNFQCSSSKEETMRDIQSFLESDKAINWVQNYDESWIFQYEVRAGVETKNCLDKMPFDLTKHFIFERNIVKPEYSKETCWVSVTENKKWGKTHRYDETYRIISSTASYDPNIVVAYVYLNCASKTNECRSACGALLSSLTCQDNMCDNCGLSLDTGRKCCHCKTTTSSQWYYKGTPRELCATCYTYKQRKGCDRPIDFSSKGSKYPHKLHHEHLQCQWRMKLEMKLNNLNTWNVYESSENISYHVSVPIQVNKKPALGIRDTWDKLRVSRKATSLQIHTIENKGKEMTVNRSECTDQITHPLSQIKARCELVDKHHSGKNSTDEPYQLLLSEEPQVDNETVVHIPQKDQKSQRQMQLEACEANHTRICGICFEEGINPPFTCITKRDLDAHKNKMHNGYGDLCALCYKEMGMVVRFEDNRELMQHLNKHKVKYDN